MAGASEGGRTAADLILRWADASCRAEPALVAHRVVGDASAGVPVSWHGLGVRVERLSASIRGAIPAGWVADGALAPKPVVGITVDDAADWVVAMLATWRSGCAYVSVEASLPRDRRALMLAGCAVVLGADKAAAEGAVEGLGPSPLSGLPADARRALVGFAEVLATVSDAAPEEAEGPDGSTTCGGAPPLDVTDAAAFRAACEGDSPGPALVVYTSGSTGAPMPVVLTHAHLLARTRWWWHTVSMSRDRDVGMHKTATTWIDSVTEIVQALAAGVRLVVPSRAARGDAGALLDQVRAHGVTRLWAVPSLLRSMMAVARSRGAASMAELCPSLSLVVTTGEALSRAMFDDMRASLPGTTLVNSYGCSETSGDFAFKVFAPGGDSDAAWGVPPEAADAAIEPSPVGVCATPCCVVRLLKPGSDEAAAEGAIGEVVVSRGVASHYPGFPEQSARKFVRIAHFVDGARGAATAGAAEAPDAASATAGGAGDLVFRTGDLGILSPVDGSLWLCGRADRQVKLRGQRINLTEVEGAIEALRDVRAVAVVARPTGVAGLKRLVAFVQLGRDSDTTACVDDGKGDGAMEDGKDADADVRVPASAEAAAAVARVAAGAAGKLPAYAVPAFVPVARLPLLPNGKLNRSLLVRRAARCELDIHTPAAGAGGLVADRGANSGGGGGSAGLSATEARVADVWARMLVPAGDASYARARMRPDTDFFELGGDSVAVVLMLARLRPSEADEGRAALTVSDIADWSLAGVAAALDRAAAGTAGPADDSALADLDDATTALRGYRVVPWTEEYFEAAVALLATTFATREPLCVAVGASAAEVRALTEEGLAAAMQAGMSTVAITTGADPVGPRVIAVSVALPVEHDGDEGGSAAAPEAGAGAGAAAETAAAAATAAADPDKPETGPDGGEECGPPAVFAPILAFLGGLEARYKAEVLDLSAAPLTRAVDMWMTAAEPDTPAGVLASQSELALAVERGTLLAAARAGCTHATATATHPVTEHIAVDVLGFVPRVTSVPYDDYEHTPEGGGAAVRPFAGKVPAPCTRAVMLDRALTAPTAAPTQAAAARA